jgi:hypothetical protein
VILKKPHTLSVVKNEERIVDNVSLGHQETSQGSVNGQLVPVDAQAVYERFGVETRNGWEFYCDVADASKFAVGGSAAMGAKTFSVIAPPRTYDGFGKADHSVIALEEQD